MSQVADRFFRWYRSRSTREDFLQQADFLAQRGIFLEHPTFKTGVVLNIDGDDVRLTPVEIARLIDLKLAAVNVKFWFSADADLSCKFSWIPLGMEVQMYHLENLTSAHAVTTQSALTEYRREEGPTTFGYVLDRDGRSAEFDWDLFYDGLSLGAVPAVEVWPDVLAIRGTVEQIRQTLDIPASVRVATACDATGAALVEITRL